MPHTVRGNQALADVIERAAHRCENPNTYPGDDADVLRRLATGLRSGRLEVVDVQAPIDQASSSNYPLTER